MQEHQLQCRSINLVLALAAKRVALGKSQAIACLNVSTAILHAEMKDEVYIKMDADTFRLIRDETCQTCNLSTMKVLHSGQSLYGYRSSPRFWKDAVAEAAEDLGLKPSKIDISTCTWTTNFSLETISLCVTWNES